MKLRDQIQRIAIEMRSYGSPRMTAEIRKRTNSRINHKRVERSMREDNLLCVRRRIFVRTTDSNHGLPIYQNLTRGLELTGVDQLWVSDITYIRLQSEFVYLAVILDRFSRRVIGWELGRTLEVELALSASAYGFGRKAREAGNDSSLRSRIAVRVEGVYRTAQGARNFD